MLLVSALRTALMGFRCAFRNESRKKAIMATMYLRTRGRTTTKNAWIYKSVNKKHS